MARFAFVIAATAGYEEPSRVFLNSAEKHCPDIDIYLLTEKEIPKHPENQLLMNYIYRLKFAASLSNYDAVCLVDADMFLVRDILKYFKIASDSGLIVGVSDCTNTLYDTNYLMKHEGILEKDFYNTKTISSVPLFFNPLLHGHILLEAYQYGVDNNITSDLLILNMIICKYQDIWNNMIILPAYVWTGIHHSQLKPETRIRKILGELVSEAGDEVYMIHGRWFDPKWVEGLRVTMQGYFKNHLKMSSFQSENFMVWVDESIDISLNAYKELI